MLVSRDHRSPTPQWRIEWWLAHFVGHHSTNNVAEHTAIAQGLATLLQREPTPQHVSIIGDSRLITDQLTGLARVRHRALRPIVAATLQSLALLPHVTLHHTLRAGNTMADHLANLAMDRRHHAPDNDTTHNAATLARLNQLLSNDVEHPWTARPPPQLIDRLRTTHRRLLATTTPIDRVTASPRKRPPPAPNETDRHVRPRNG